VKTGNAFNSFFLISIFQLKVLKSIKFGEAKPKTHSCLAMSELSVSRPRL
jgi:hypothetical protein